MSEVIELQGNEDLNRFLLKQFVEWEKLKAEGKKINDSKAAILDEVEAKGVARESFRYWMRRRAQDEEKQRSFDFGVECCRKASDSIRREATG